MVMNSIGFITIAPGKTIAVDKNGNQVLIDSNRVKPNCIWPTKLTPEEQKKLREDAIKNFKPGIYDPEAQKRVEERKETLLKLGGLAIATVLAFVFRGKIKTGAIKLIEKATPYAKKAVTQLEKAFPNAVKTVKRGTEKVVNYVKNVAPEIIEKGKNIYTKYAKPFVNKIIEFYEKIKPTITKK